MRIVYMGTPDFAVGALEALIGADHEILAVVTQPDKRSGRKQQVSESPVKQCAGRHGLLVLQPQRARDAAFIEDLRALAPDVIVVAAPYWDLSFPAALKTYLERVVIAGITFDYSPEGIPFSLCRAKRLLYVTTAGGPIGNHNLGFEYVKALAEIFFAIPDVQCFSAEGLDIMGADVEAILARAATEIDERMGETAEGAAESAE